MAARKKAGSGKSHRFGGDWTTTKLEVLAKYLAAYTRALKKTRFKKAYIDAFAGTGYRTRKKTGPMLPFPDLEQDLLDGSARLALQVEPTFDRYIFIERSTKRCAALEELRGEFPDLGSKISVRIGDANAEIQELCTKNWSRHRAVLFLDPYGMQVEWSTIEAVAQTQAIDMWLLFPLGIGVNRLLKKKGDVPDAWRRRLDILLGTDAWYDEFYKVERQPDLFGGEQEYVVKATMETIAQYFQKRLEGIFAGVAEPGVLRNSSNNPLYLFCFAVGNERGKNIALRIARNY